MEKPDNEAPVCLCGKNLAEHSLEEIRACAIKWGGIVTETGFEFDIAMGDFNGQEPDPVKRAELQQRP